VYELRLDFGMQLRGMCGADALVRQGFKLRDSRAWAPAPHEQLLRLDHGEEWKLLQVHELREYERVLVNARVGTGVSPVQAERSSAGFLGGARSDAGEGASHE
jgi:hypothetical protein